MDLSFTGNLLLPGILSTTGAAVRWAMRHLEFSNLPVNFQIVFMEPRMSEHELLPSEVRDRKESMFGVGCWEYQSITSVLCDVASLWQIGY